MGTYANHTEAINAITGEMQPASVVTDFVTSGADSEFFLAVQIDSPAFLQVSVISHIIPTASAGSPEVEIEYVNSGDVGTPTSLTTVDLVAAKAGLENLGTIQNFEVIFEPIALGAGTWSFRVNTSATTTSDIYGIAIRRSDSESELILQGGSMAHSAPYAVWDSKLEEIVFGGVFAGDDPRKYLFTSNGVTTNEIFSTVTAIDPQDIHHNAIIPQFIDGSVVAIMCDHNQDVFAVNGSTIGDLATDTPVLLSPNNRSDTYIIADTNRNGTNIGFACRTTISDGSSGGRIYILNDPSGDLSDLFTDRLGDTFRFYPADFRFGRDDANTKDLGIYVFQIRQVSDWKSVFAGMYDASVGTRGQHYNLAGVPIGDDDTGQNESNLRFTSTQTTTLVSAGGLEIIDEEPGGNHRYITGRPASRIKEWNATNKIGQVCALWVENPNSDSNAYDDMTVNLTVAEGANAITVSDPFPQFENLRSMRIESYCSFDTSGVVGNSSDDVIIVVTGRGTDGSREGKAGIWAPPTPVSTYHREWGGDRLHFYRIRKPFEATDEADLRRRIFFLGTHAPTLNITGDDSGDTVTLTNPQLVEGTPGTFVYQMGENSIHLLRTQVSYETFDVSTLISETSQAALVDGTTYLTIAEQYAGARDSERSARTFVYDAVYYITNVQELSPELDLIDSLYNQYLITSDVFGSTVKYLSAVKSLNSHVLRNSDFATLSEYLAAENIFVPRSWAELSAQSGYSIDEAYIDESPDA